MNKKLSIILIINKTEREKNMHNKAQDNFQPTKMGKSAPTKKPKVPAPPAAKNPFDERSNKKEKHPALNRKILGANRNVGQARRNAQERRETELLSDFASRNSASHIEDRRFGESNQALSREEKMLKRFQALRSSRSKRYNLEDDSAAGEDLTHLGQSLGLTSFGGDEEDEEEEDVDELVQRLKAGESFAGDCSKRKLTKKEAMLDVVRKSKMLKMERQKEKGEDEEERDRLDSMTSSLVQQLAFRNKHSASAATTLASSSDGYDKLVRDLAASTKVVASDRTKTAEEQAKAERESLEALEEMRVRRMDGEEDDEEEEQDQDPRRRKRTKPLAQSSKPALATLAAAADDEVPFLIQAPASHLELLEFLHSYPTASLDVVLSRIRTTNSVHLGGDNRAKLLALIPILLDHAAVVAGQESPASDLAILTTHLFALCQLSPKEAASGFFNRLEAWRRRFELELAQVKPETSLDLGAEHEERPHVRLPGGHKEGLAAQHNAALDRFAQLTKGTTAALSSPTRVWPTRADFALATMIAEVFSTSDFRHPVTTPCALLLGRILVESPLRGPQDGRCALATAQLLERMTRSEARFAPPELFCFVSAVATTAVEGTTPEAKRGTCLRRLRGKRSGALAEVVHSGGSETVISLALRLVDSVSTTVGGSSGDVLLGPLTLFDPKAWPEVASKAQAKVEALVKSRSKLRLQEFAPVVKQADPKLTTAAARPNEVERSLLKKVKRERKGVARELRLDGQFLAEASHKERRSKLEAVREVRRKNFGDLQQQQANFNQLAKSGFAIKGAGVGGLNLKGRRMGKRSVE